MSANQLYVFDVSMKRDAATRKLLKEYLAATCKQWVFQGETGASGYKHWQIRFSLLTKARMGTVLTAWNQMFGPGFGKLSNTSTKEAQHMLKSGNAFYCMKAASRTEGPYSDKDVAARYIQKRFENAKCKEWQERLFQQITLAKATGDDRHIILVVDPDGGAGKSWFKGWMYSHHGALVLPSSLQTVNDAIQFICSLKDTTVGWSGVILMDIPRATSEKHWWTMAQGLETIKQGFLHDVRYGAKMKVIEPPVLVAFCNSEPPSGVMSSDVFTRFSFE